MEEVWEWGACPQRGPRGRTFLSHVRSAGRCLSSARLPRGARAEASPDSGTAGKPATPRALSGPTPRKPAPRIHTGPRPRRRQLGLSKGPGVWGLAPAVCRCTHTEPRCSADGAPGGACARSEPHQVPLPALPRLLCPARLEDDPRHSPTRSRPSRARPATQRVPHRGSRTPPRPRNRCGTLRVFPSLNLLSASGRRRHRHGAGAPTWAETLFAIPGAQRPQPLGGGGLRRSSPTPAAGPRPPPGGARAPAGCGSGSGGTPSRRPPPAGTRGSRWSVRGRLRGWGFLPTRTRAVCRAHWPRGPARGRVFLGQSPDPALPCPRASASHCEGENRGPAARLGDTHPLSTWLLRAGPCRRRTPAF